MPVNMYWVNFWRLVVLTLVLSVWQWGDDVNQWLVSGLESGWRKALTIVILEPFFISKPTEIWARFLDLACFTDRDGTWLPGVSGVPSATISPPAITATRSARLWASSM